MALVRDHRVLVGAGEHRDRLTQFTVGGQRSVQVGIDTHDVGQCHRVGVIGL
jgi:hypothetical protein